MSIVFLRRRKLGKGSVKGMRAWLSEMSIPNAVYNSWTGNMFGDVEEHNLLVRWGCTANTPPGNWTVINNAQGIHRVNDKRGFRSTLTNYEPSLVPTTIISGDGLPCDDSNYPLIVRPSKHAQGKNLWVVNNLEEFLQVTSQLPEWYASEVIDKKQEFRVYIVSGRVVTVAEKVPHNPEQIAWNVAQGGRFDVVPWGNWNLDACRTSLEAFEYSGLDFGGVDVMVDKNGRPYVIEINSAPSLPLLSNGSVSYRQKCMAKAFAYIYENGKEYFNIPEGDNWRDFIHPAIWSE